MKVNGGNSVRTLGDLRIHACKFNPFSNLEVLAATRAPQPADFDDINQCMAVKFARERLEEWGFQPFYQWLNVQMNR